MSSLVAVIAVTLLFLNTSPRRTGRWLGKVYIGFKAQLKDEGQ